MNVFQLRNSVLGDYRRYVGSFLKIRDERIRDFVKKKLEAGVFGYFEFRDLLPAS